MYNMDMDDACSKIANEEEYIKKIYMEQYLLQGIDAKEQAALTDLIEAIQSSAKELNEEFVRSKVVQLTTYNLLYALYEKLLELDARAEVALWILRSIRGQLLSQSSQVSQSADKGTKETEKSIQDISKQLESLELYVKIEEAERGSVPATAPTALYSWFIFYDHILAHTEKPGTKLEPAPKWSDFGKDLAKAELDTRAGHFLLSSLRSSDQTLASAWQASGVRLSQLVDWFTQWLDGQCGCQNCGYTTCSLWRICKDQANPVSSWLGTVESFFKGDMTKHGVAKATEEELKKREGPVDEQAYWKKMYDYCMNSHNLLHVVILANILKGIPAANAQADFGLVEQAGKFALLILSNLKETECGTSGEGFSLGKGSVYEFLAKWQVEGNEKVKNKHFQIEMCDLKSKDFLKCDKLDMGLSLDLKFKQFAEYVKDLQIQDNYFYSGLTRSQGTGSAAPEEALKFYKDPVYLLFKLTKHPEAVKDAITLHRLWLYAQHWQNNEDSAVEDISVIYAEYTYVENVALRVGAFVRLWKKFLSQRVLTQLNTQAKPKGLQSPENRAVLERLCGLISAFIRDVKTVKASAKECITGEKDATLDEKTRVKRIVKDGYKLELSAPLYEKGHKCLRFKDTKAIHNMLHDPTLAEAKQLLRAETAKYLKRYADKTIEKEYVMANRMDEESKDKTKGGETPIAALNDVLYKREARLVELTIRILLAELKIDERRDKKAVGSAKKGKHHKRRTVYEILSLNMKTLTDIVCFYGSCRKETLRSVLVATSPASLLARTKVYSLCGEKCSFSQATWMRTQRTRSTWPSCCASTWTRPWSTTSSL